MKTPWAGNPETGSVGTAKWSNTQPSQPGRRWQSFQTGILPAQAIFDLLVLSITF